MGRRDRRPPQGPLRADAPRGVVLARALEGGRRGARPRDQHVEPVGRLRQRRPGELRRGEGGHRRLHAHRRAGARPLRRHRQLHRAERAHAHDRGDVRRDAEARGAGSTRWIPRTCRRSSSRSRGRGAGRSRASASSSGAAPSTSSRPWDAGELLTPDERWDPDEFLARAARPLPRAAPHPRGWSR